MTDQDTFQKLKNAVLNADDSLLDEALNEIKRENIDRLDAISKGLSPAMDDLGKKMEKGEVFLSEVLLSALTMERGASELLKGAASSGGKTRSLGRIILGTVQGDIHDVGKKMVHMMLLASGFEVYDMGKDISAMTFIEEAQKKNADIIAMSALMTITRPALREVIQTLSDMGLRGKYKILVGGGAVTEEYAQQIGADGHGKNMTEAPKIARKLLT